MKSKKKFPFFSIIILAAIFICCLGCELFMTHDPSYMDLSNINHAPDSEFLFGTDTLGRDIFSMIFYGGRISLFIGITATAISTGIAIIYGSLSGIAPQWLDEILMRFTEILLSIPSILLIIFIQAMTGQNNVPAISAVIGCTSWMGIAKMVRTEVKKARTEEYVIAARLMGGGFFHNLHWHFIPNFFSSIFFMVIMNIRSAMITESTLSFLGLGLPMEIISWGSMLSLAEKEMVAGSFWSILIPGIFLAATLLCITEIGNYIRKNML